LRFESRQQPLLSREKFLRRLAHNIAAAGILIGISLLIGMTGYHCFEDLPWIDAFANASMILSGMGPLGELKTWGGKLFAGCYALYGGLSLIRPTSVIMAPILHRVMHRLHLEASKGDKKNPARRYASAGRSISQLINCESRHKHFRHDQAHPFFV